MNREERLAKKRAYNKVYYVKNREELVLKKRKYCKENREKVNGFQRQYVARNRELIKQRKKNYYLRNRDKIMARRKERAEQMAESRRKYRIKNADKIREYNRNRYRSSIQYRIAKVIRSRIQDAVKREHKSARTEKLLGTTFPKFKKYLESLFKQDMSWENYGKWEIDHIIPLSSFDLTKEQEQLKAFHYTNTQPLWRKENRVKSSKILN